MVKHVIYLILFIIYNSKIENYLIYFHFDIYKEYYRGEDGFQM